MYLKMIELDTNKYFIQKNSDQLNNYIVLENGPKRNEKIGLNRFQDSNYTDITNRKKMNHKINYLIFEVNSSKNASIL